MSRHIGNRQSEGKVLGLLGCARVELGELQLAVEVYKEWLAMAREIDDVVSQGNALYNLGMASRALGEHEQAVRWVHEALVNYEQYGAKHFAENARAKLAEWGAVEGSV
jgi:tetratricopeptide (TPR) repeat protein